MRSSGTSPSVFTEYFLCGSTSPEYARKWHPDAVPKMTRYVANDLRLGVFIAAKAVEL